MVKIGTVCEGVSGFTFTIPGNGNNVFEDIFKLAKVE